MTVTLTKISREYVDLDFSLERHPLTGNVSIKKQVSSVRQSIRHLLLLKSGDKPFHPEIKSPIYDYLFENASPVVKVVLEGEVLKYLNVFEPRVEIARVIVSFPNANELTCTIEGSIINLSEPFTVSILVSRLR